jgi:hypothetical protein
MNRNNFIRGKRIYMPGMKRVSYKRNILWKEYLANTHMYKDATRNIKRDRIVCAYQEG